MTDTPSTQVNPIQLQPNAQNPKARPTSTCIPYID